MLLNTLTFDDPPTLADLETMRAKMNEFILAARRQASQTRRRGDKDSVLVFVSATFPRP